MKPPSSGFSMSAPCAEMSSFAHLHCWVQKQAGSGAVFSFDSGRRRAPIYGAACTGFTPDRTASRGQVEQGIVLVDRAAKINVELWPKLGEKLAQL